MKKMKLLVAFLIAIKPFLLYSTNIEVAVFHPGDTLYSWADRGLNIRSSPGRSADKIGNIPFGKVMIFLGYDIKGVGDKELFYGSSDLDTMINDIPFKCKEYFQDGWWIKIQYKDIIGFVFSGFTSRYKPWEKDSEILYVIQNNFYLISKDEQYNEYEDCTIRYLYFNKGVNIISKLCTGGDWTYIIPNMTLQEAVLFTRENVKSHFKNVMPLVSPCPIEFIGNKENGFLVFSNNTNWSMTITWINNVVIINESVWC